MIADQKSKAEPIIRDLDDTTLKLMGGDKSLTREELRSRPWMGRSSTKANHESPSPAYLSPFHAI
jgi:hypothetical protein